MYLDYLDRYIWEAEAHANELLELYPYEDREAIGRDFAANPTQWMSFERLLLSPPKLAFVFLSEGPTAQERRLDRMETLPAQGLWFQARYLAIRSARELRHAATVVNVKGYPYRKAVRRVAEAISQFPVLPSPMETAVFEFHC